MTATLCYQKSSRLAICPTKAGFLAPLVRCLVISEQKQPPTSGFRRYYGPSDHSPTSHFDPSQSWLS